MLATVRKPQTPVLQHLKTPAHPAQWVRRLRHAVLAAALFLASCGGAGLEPASPAGATAGPQASQPQGPDPERQGFGLVTIPTRPAQFSSIWSCPPYTDWGLPSMNVDLLCRVGFAAGHDPDTKGPRWVIEQLTPAKLRGAALRKDNFRPDPDLQPGQRAELSDYTNSGFDRGHMAAAADMAWSQTAMDERFMLSNIVPQSPSLNRGPWARLEDQVRDWVADRETLVVITGPVYRSNRSIGRGVRVPDGLYKVVFDPSREEAMVLMLPNEPVERYNAPQYFATLAALERDTGLKLLNRRP